MAQSLLSNALVASAGRVVNTGLGIVATLLLARYLGPAGYGTYSLLMAYGVMWQLLADFGLYLTLTREIAQYPDREQKIVSEIITLRVSLLLLAFAIGTAVATFIPTLVPYRLVFLFAAAGLLFQSLSQLLMGIYQKHSIVGRATAGDILGRLAQLLILAGLIAGGMGLYGTVGAFTIAAAVAFGIQLHLLPLRLVKSHSWSYWQHLLKTSWPLGAMLLLNAVYFRIDTLILSFFRDEAVVGHYSLAYRVIESSLFFPAMLGGLLLPRLSRAALQRSTAEARQLVTEGLQVVLMVGSLVMLLLILRAEPIVVFLGGSEFRSAGRLLQVLSGALAAMFFGNIFGFALIALQKQRFLLMLYAVLVVINVLGNLWFIPRYGALAAAWTTVLTECLSCALAAAVVYRHLTYRLPVRTIFYTAVTTLATGLLLGVLPQSWHILVQVAIAGIFYGALAVLFRVVSREQLALLTARPPL